MRNQPELVPTHCNTVQKFPFSVIFVPLFFRKLEFSRHSRLCGLKVRPFYCKSQERSKWRGLINKGAALYEKKRICEAERKRRERKAKTNVPPADSMTLTCSTCNRQFRARIGLVSHQRTHQHTSALFKK